MAKRKAGVNNIIFELDNEDIELSSEDEVKEPKISCFERSNSSNLNIKDTNLEETCSDEISVDKSCKTVNNISSPTTVHNGGKISLDFVSIDLKSDLESNKNKDEVDSIKKPTSDLCKTTILNEDTVVDSPGNSDLGVEGCENRTPLITVRFSNKQLAVNFKQQIKAFILNLLKLHESDSLGSDETDLELDIWPEDLHEKVPEAVEENVENSLFFVDTIPGDDKSDDVPRYRKTSSLISNIPDKEPTPPPTRRGPSCFNCDGDHSLRDCPKPRDFVRIANNRKKLPARLGRYHVEDEQKFGHLIPGRISRHLRHALGLRRDELPLHIYRMRLLGYPPGWLEEARISHSGIAMFDSSGNAILEADDEEGEVIEPGSKDKFDIKKILDFPGFNVPPSPRYKEDAHLKGLPPMADHDSKLAMLQFLAPNAMKAYKRKKLTMFPSVGSNNTAMEGQAEMELDSGDEITEFPSVPPLPDDVPPPPPPPPSCPPPPETPPPPLPPPPKDDASDDDLKVIEVLKVGDIPIPMSDFIVIDEDDGELDETETNDRASPSLIDLEAKKQLLLNALEVTDTSALDKTEILNETTDPPNDNTQESSFETNSGNVGAKDSAKADEVVEDTAVAVNIPSDNKNVDKVLDVITHVGVKVDNVADKKTDKTADNNKPQETVTEQASQESTSSMTFNDTQESTSSMQINDTQESTSSMQITDTQESISSRQIIDTQESTSSTTIPDSQESTPSIQITDTQESTSQVMCSQETISSYQEMGSQESLPSSQIMDTQVSTISKLESQESATSSSQSKCSQSGSSVPRTPDSKTGFVRDTEYGTPVMNIASSYVKLPSDDKFAKDICDVINFENLPNSTGKYKKICALLKKVKSEVDRIQES